MPLYEYVCNGECGKVFERITSFAERNNVDCCGVPATKLISQVYTHKDKAYEFTDESGVEVRTKGQYKEYLKRNHIIDASIKESRQHAFFRKKENVVRRKEERKRIARKMADQMRKDNVLQDVPSLINNFRKKEE